MGTSRSKFPISAPLCAAFTAVPVVLSPYFFSSVFVLPKLGVCAAASLAAVGILLYEGTWRDVRSRVDLPLSVFCAAAVLAGLVSVDPRMSFNGQQRDILFSLTGLAGCVVAFYLGCACARRGTAGKIIPWAAGASLIVSVAALGQAAGFDVFGATFWSGNRRVSSTMGNPVLLGAYLALILPLTLHLSVQNGRGRILGVVSGGAAAIALLLTGSRGAWLGSAAGVSLYLLTRYGPAPRRPFFAGGFLAVGLLLGLGVFWMRDAAEMRWSDSTRTEIWAMALSEFASHPVVGSGTNTFSITFTRRESEGLARIYQATGAQNHAHNDWLQVLATMGMIGMVSYAWLHYRVVCSLQRDRRGEAAAFAAAACAVLMQAKFNSPSFAVAWLACVLAGGALYSEKQVNGAGFAGPWLLVGCGVWFVVMAVASLAADRYDYLGQAARRRGRMREAARHFERAIVLNPDADDYRYDFANLLWDVASGTPERRMLLQKVSETAREGLARHPYSIDMHRLLGMAELRWTQWTGEDRLAQARSAFDTAYRLGPNFRETLTEMITVVELQGDAEKRIELESRLKRIGG